MSALVGAVSGFASGVFLRSFLFHNAATVLFALYVALALAVSWFLTERRHYFVGGFFFFTLALGMIRMGAADEPIPAAFASDLRHRVSYDAIVVGDPDLRDANERVVIEVAAHGETVRMLAVVPRTTTVAVGDRVRATGTLVVPQPFASEHGRVFRYDKYLEKDGVRFLLEYATLRIESSAPWYEPRAFLARLKHLFTDAIAQALPEPNASLASGIVIGGKSGLGAELKDAFVTSGLVQIVVLSGYNVMVVAEWVMAALAFVALSRRARAAAGAGALIFFVGVAGATATSIRAAIMALIALYARATGKTYAASRALFFAIFLMLLWNPLYLAYDPGFALSVAATAGLIWLAPLLEARLPLRNAFWKNAVATTLAAQIAVLPLLLYFTGTLSLVALPANLLAMPLVPLAMGLAALAGTISALVPPLAALVGFPAYLLSALLILLAKESAALPGAALSVPAFPFWLVLFAYAALAAFASSKRFSTTDQFTLSRKAST